MVNINDGPLYEVPQEDADDLRMYVSRQILLAMPHAGGPRV